VFRIVPLGILELTKRACADGNGYASTVPWAGKPLQERI
jgi:hypothetical protein